MSRWLSIAFKMAERSTHPKHQLAALVVKGGAIISAAVNLHRRYRCAEARALRPHLDLEGATLYVVRANGRISKPCPNCARMIEKARISEVVYIDSMRNAVKEKVRDLS